MIRYQSDSWLICFYWWGGISRGIIHTASVYGVFLVAQYVIKVEFKEELWIPNDDQVFESGLKGILGFLVFLIVFRLNQCMSRHVEGVEDSYELFVCLEHLLVIANTSLQSSHTVKGIKEQFARDKTGALGKEEEAQATAQSLRVASKVNIIRLILALSISVLLHFQLVDAAQDNMGILDDMEVKQVIFFYCRLRSLLYREEMNLVDRALCVTCERRADGGYIQRMVFGEAEPAYRAEYCRHRSHRQDNHNRLIGEHLSDVEHGGTACPLPKILTMILLNALSKPTDEPWGYSSRTINTLLRTVGAFHEKLGNLMTLIMYPTPLQYLQHCRILFWCFALVYPCSMHPDRGWTDNIGIPFFIIWALLGFDYLSGMMENPLGNDESDVDFISLVHSLEVQAEFAFEATETHHDELWAALDRPLKDFNMAFATEAAMVHAEGPSNKFRTYFHWRPLPTMILADNVEVHGHVDLLHNIRMNLCSGSGEHKGMRSALRSYQYRKQGGDYTAVTQASDEEQFLPDELGYGSDPKQGWFYLAYNGACAAETSQQYEDPAGKKRPCQHESWETRAGELLRGHCASSLLVAADDEDTQRSLVASYSVQKVSPLSGVAGKSSAGNRDPVSRQGSRQMERNSSFSSSGSSDDYPDGEQ